VAGAVIASVGWAGSPEVGRGRAWREQSDPARDGEVELVAFDDVEGQERGTSGTDDGLDVPTKAVVLSGVPGVC